MTHGELIKNGLNDWAGYFRRKIPDHVAIMYLEKIEPFTDETIKLLFDTALQQLEPKPSNFPSLKYVSQFLGNTEERSFRYNEKEDQRFPVGKLWEGFRILEKGGEAAFYNFCNSVNMPLNDRQRVLSKHKIGYNIKDLF